MVELKNTLRSRSSGCCPLALRKELVQKLLYVTWEPVLLGVLNTVSLLSNANFTVASAALLVEFSTPPSGWKWTFYREGR
jgi:hypothetical protein